MQAIERTFAILRLVAHDEGEIGVSRMAEKLGLPKSTVSRFVAALVAEGVVRRSTGGRFYLGQGLLALTKQKGGWEGLIAVARPGLIQLNKQTGEAVGLSVREGRSVTYLDHVASQHAVQVVDWTGQSVPLHTTSSGKLMLAWCDPAGLAAYLSEPLEAFTPHTLVSPTALKDELAAIRQQGLATTDEEFALGVVGFAVPVCDPAGELISAITLYGPKFRLTNPEALIAQLKKSRTLIEARLFA